MEFSLCTTSRVAHGPHCVHAVANTPAGRMELVRSYNFIRFGLPTKPGRVGSCITIFGACSAFTHVTACTLAKSPSDSLHQRLQQSRCLHCCSDCYRVERTSSRAGLTPAVDHHLSRRTRFGNLSGTCLIDWSAPPEYKGWESIVFFWGGGAKCMPTRSSCK